MNKSTDSKSIFVKETNTPCNIPQEESKNTSSELLLRIANILSNERDNANKIKKIIGILK